MSLHRIGTKEKLQTACSRPQFSLTEKCSIFRFRMNALFLSRSDNSQGNFTNRSRPDRVATKRPLNMAFLFHFLAHYFDSVPTPDTVDALSETSSTSQGPTADKVADTAGSDRVSTREPAIATINRRVSGRSKKSHKYQRSEGKDKKPLDFANAEQFVGALQRAAELWAILESIETEVEELYLTLREHLLVVENESVDVSQQSEWCQQLIQLLTSLTVRASLSQSRRRPRALS